MSESRKNLNASLSWLIVTVFSLFLITGCEKGNTISEAQSESFIKFFGGSYYDIANYAIQTPDGGYIFTGTTTNVKGGSPLDTDILLEKTDKYGNARWKIKKFGNKFDDQGNCIAAAPDGGYYIIGTSTDTTSISNTPQTNMILLKVDANGNMKWEQTYGGIDNDGGNNIQVMDGGDLILAGYTSSYGNGGRDAWLVKTDKDGNMIWSETYGGKEDDEADFVQQTQDGFIFTGSTKSFPSVSDHSNVFIVKTNSLGKATQQIAPGGDGNDKGTCIRADGNGGFYYLATSESKDQNVSQIILSHIQSQINITSWTANFGESEFFAAGNFQVMENGDFIISGTQKVSDESNMILIWASSKDGSLLKMNLFGNAGASQQATGVLQTSDNGFLLYGNNDYEGNSMATLIRTNQQGDL
ncbi:MAG TPA: hypothetical protein VE912_12190 [Bacteroidales bacterium]|nr:hypothetical protein [Bacteroidales bacterium]